MLLALGCHHFGCHLIVPDPITKVCGEQLGQRVRVSIEGLWREEFAVLVCMRPLCVASDVFFSPFPQAFTVFASKAAQGTYLGNTNELG